MSSVVVTESLRNRVERDLRTFKIRCGVYSSLSVIFILSEVTTACMATVLSISEYIQYAYVFSAISALLITIEGTFGVRERAASTFSTVNRLRGIENNLELIGLRTYAKLDDMWLEYNSIHADRKVNYLEGIMMLCT